MELMKALGEYVRESEQQRAFEEKDERRVSEGDRDDDEKADQYHVHDRQNANQHVCGG